MAVLRTNIDITLLAAGIASGANTVVPHNLAGAPHVVNIRYVGTQAQTADWRGGVSAYVGANNVTLYNSGAMPTGIIEMTSMIFHSIIQ